MIWCVQVFHRTSLAARKHWGCLFICKYVVHSGPLVPTNVGVTGAERNTTKWYSIQMAPREHIIQQHPLHICFTNPPTLPSCPRWALKSPRTITAPSIEDSLITSPALQDALGRCQYPCHCTAGILQLLLHVSNLHLQFSGGSHICSRTQLQTPQWLLKICATKHQPHHNLSLQNSHQWALHQLFHSPHSHYWLCSACLVHMAKASAQLEQGLQDYP